MGRGAWWATASGSQRVGHNLVTKRQAGTAQIQGPHHFIAIYTLC